MNIRQVRKKIKSINNVKKITKAMQLVSAIKMKKAQQKAVEGKPYREHLARIISKLIINFESNFSLLMTSQEDAALKDLVIFVSSNKGLCGSFNFNLFRFITSEIDFQSSDFITIGTKGALLVSKMAGNILADFSTGSRSENVSAVFQTALTSFLAGKYKKVILIYNKFISTLNSQPIKKIILPINVETIIKEFLTIKGEYIVEPSPAKIVDSVLRSLIEEEIRGAISESEAAEHSARMIAMKNATENAEDVVYNLTLLRNKLRQEKITYELLDMITAKESVEIG